MRYYGAERVMPVELIWIEAHYPGRTAVLAGFILLGNEATKERIVEVSLLRDWSFVSSEDDREVLTGMEGFICSLLKDDLERGLAVLQNASNVLRVSDRLQVIGGKADISELRCQLNRLLLAADSGGASLSASA